MSGHSKWSTIKHKKAKTDSARAATGREVTMRGSTVNKAVNR